MKRHNITPTNIEKVMKENDFIVSKTDLKGKIIYCNRIFIEMCGYEESELIGTNHNIIRHPDMPRIAFKVLWERLHKGQEFFGFVKNLRKDGGFYWVFANIMPDFDQNGKIVSYTSVRRKPNPEALKIIEPIYKDLLIAEKSGGMNASGEIISKLLDEKKVGFNQLMITLQGSY